jgi:hypothetical protein
MYSFILLMVSIPHAKKNSWHAGKYATCLTCYNGKLFLDPLACKTKEEFYEVIRVEIKEITHEQ